MSDEEALAQRLETVRRCITEIRALSQGTYRDRLLDLCDEIDAATWGHLRVEQSQLRTQKPQLR